MLFRRNCVLMAAVIFLVAGLIVGCGSKESADTKATTGAASSTYGKAVEKAKETVAELENPKQGFDPVCDMAIDGSLVVTVDGKKYGFCSQHCADMFKENPEKYLAAATKVDH
jgi:YHS domain-containing protein